MPRRLVVVLILAACVACSSSSVAPEEELTQAGRTLIRYEGAELQALVSYRWADAHLGDEWLVLVAWLSGGRSATTVIDRNAITLRGPDGTRYPLPSQQAFREAYPEILSALRSVDLSYPPGRGFAGERRVDQRRLAGGRRRSRRRCRSPAAAPPARGAPAGRAAPRTARPARAGGTRCRPARASTPATACQRNHDPRRRRRPDDPLGGGGRPRHLARRPTRCAVRQDPRSARPPRRLAGRTGHRSGTGRELRRGDRPTRRAVSPSRSHIRSGLSRPRPIS